MLSSHVALSILTFVIVVLNVNIVAGQDYPIKPVRIVTAAAGGGNDFISRLIAQAITGPLGQPVIVENRATALAAEAVAKAPADGYAMLVAGGGLWALHLMQKNVPYDMKDFAPVAMIAREVYIVAVHPSLPVKSIKEFIALAKAKPGELNYGMAGMGGAPHLSVELLKSMAGVDITRIGYKGASPAATGLVGGEVQLFISDVGLLTPLIKSGRVRALAVTSPEPSALTPGLPTVASGGLPGYEFLSLVGLFVPARTSDPIIRRLNLEVVRALGRTDVKEKLLSAGAEPASTSPEEWAAIIRADIERRTRIIKEAGIPTS